MTDFPDGPGVDLNGIFTPDSRCGRLRRELKQMIRPALDAGMRLEDHPAVRDHLAQLRFAEDRFSDAATADMQVRQGIGNAEFRVPGDPPCSEQKPARIGTVEAGRILEVCSRSVLNLIYRGSLEGTRTGRGWIVDAGSVAALCEERRKENDESKAA